ncbi:MAG: hypothetical protein H6Q49_541 [Deltaproteobacteria bacterium]|nr:hypothetical protein [Deltaproteobacteria bacterium]
MSTHAMTGRIYRSPVSNHGTPVVSSEISMVILVVDPVGPAAIVISSPVFPARVRESGNGQPRNH